MITYQQARKLLTYNSKTGELRWRNPVGHQTTGSVGTPDGKGYLQVHIRPRLYRVHRLIWLWKTGEWPAEQIDHKNGIRDDNRWCNLRLANQQQQNWNQKIYGRKNKTGIKGVFWHEECKGYAAVIHAKGQKLWLGAYPTPELAAVAYRQAAKKYFGEFARAS